MFNRALFFLTHVVLSVFVSVCVYARLSYSLSLANLTYLTRGLKTYTTLTLLPSCFLDSLVQDPRGPARLLRIREVILDIFGEPDVNKGGKGIWK